MKPFPLKHLPNIARRTLSSDLSIAKPVLLATETFTASLPDGTSAPPVLVAHGLLGSKANWQYIGRSLANHCSPQRKVILTDARNHGESPHVDEHSYDHTCADFLSLMEVSNIPKASVMGHSMGGRTVMYFSLKYGEKVDKAIILDISPVNHKTEAEFSFIRFILETMNEVKFPTGVPKANARGEADKQLAVKIPQPKLRQFILTNMIETNGGYGWRINLPVLIKNFYNNIRTFPDVKGRVFNGPVLFLLGGESVFVRPKDHAFIKDLFPNVQFVTVPKTGHWLHAEKPREVVRICANFLNAN